MANRKLKNILYILYTQLFIVVKFKKIKSKNVKTFGKVDDKIALRIEKFLMTIVVNLKWELIKLFHWLNGIKPPKVISLDLLVIVRKGDYYKKFKV